MQEDAFFGKAAQRLRPQMSRLQSGHIVVLVKSFAALRYNDGQFFDAAGLQLQRSMSELSAAQVVMGGGGVVVGGV